MNKSALLIAFLSAFVGFGQNYTGSFDSIKQDGLHSFLIGTEVRSAAKENFGSLRIKDSKNNQIPYVLVYDTDKVSSVFKPATVVSKLALKDSITSITIENKSKKIQSELTLRIANTNISKSYTIFGSNNNKKWYGLVVNQHLSGLNSTQSTTTERTIGFPLNTYQYLRIDFNDKTSLPINILNVGVYESKFFTQNPLEIKGYEKETIKVDRKVTRLKFRTDKAHKIDVISFNIESDFYLRKAKVIVKRKKVIKKREKTYEDVIAEFQLNSKKENTFVLNNLNENEFWIEIENQDNPELNITDVNFFQKPIYLVSNLKKGDKYRLIIDNELLTPSYDLGNFITNKTNTIDEVKLTNFTGLTIEKEESKQKSFWQTSLFMWICIGLGGSIVVFFALGLLKDISNEKSS